ncbi:glycoside hydrolase family 55 protein, partial [Streptomyces laculatispora]|uniref:glycoside hydrolase family 55 protein n=1 Tax=Streptomyces laculatispora TaxID=887464 RepID=UPI001F5FF3DF
MATIENFSRRGLLGSAVAVAATAATGWAGGGTAFAAGGDTAAGADGRGQVTLLWREFAAAPLTHPQIPFIGLAGYRGGADLPRRTGHGFTANVLHYGAEPDNSADAAPAINRAIAAAGERGGGTVLIPEGTYRIDDIIRIGHSNVVVRGAGSGRTKLYATRNLTELIGVYGSRYGGDKSSWSWAGGLIWLCPEDRWTSLTDAIKAKDWPFEGWTGNKRDAWRTLTTVAPARLGDRTITVDDTRGIRRGALVLLRLADDSAHTLLEHMAGGGPGPEAYYWDDKTKLTSYVPYEWPVRITAVHGRRVTLERPLPLDIRPE